MMILILFASLLQFVALLQLCSPVVSLSLTRASVAQSQITIDQPAASTIGRRDLLAKVLVGSGVSCLFPVSIAKAAYDDPPIVLRLESPQDKAGLALYDVTVGTNPPRTVVAIKRVLTPRLKLQPGLVLKGYPNSLAVLDRIKQGPYPIELEFYNLDQSNGELGEQLTAQDALNVAVQQSAAPATTRESTGTATTSDGDTNSYVRRVVKEPPICAVRSRRDDILEINYSAHIGSLDGIVYDASAFRGTGRPYQMVLGSGDMIPGVDQGVFNMCPGEERVIEIPPSLAYGFKGNKLFRIPPNTRLVWEVELVSVNSMRQQPQEDEEDGV